jgi:hypothetical protein
VHTKPYDRSARSTIRQKCTLNHVTEVHTEPYDRSAHSTIRQNVTSVQQLHIYDWLKIREVPDWRLEPVTIHARVQMLYPFSYPALFEQSGIKMWLTLLRDIQYETMSLSTQMVFACKLFWLLRNFSACFSSSNTARYLQQLLTCKPSACQSTAHVQCMLIV